MEIAEKVKAEKLIINPWTWQEQFGYVQAVKVSKGEQILYCAGQGSVDANGNPVHEGDMRAQINVTLDNIEEVLSQAGFALTDIVRINIYTTDIDQFFAHVDVALSRLAQVRFSSTLVEVTRLALPHMLVEIEATAVR